MGHHPCGRAIPFDEGVHEEVIEMRPIRGSAAADGNVGLCTAGRATEGSPAATDDAGLPKMHQANQMEIKGE